jgi:hypothetical protein
MPSRPPFRAPAADPADAFGAAMGDMLKSMSAG